MSNSLKVLASRSGRVPGNSQGRLLPEGWGARGAGSASRRVGVQARIGGPGLGAVVASLPRCSVAVPAATSRP